MELAIDLGGTATGEHGIGLGKRDILVREHGEASVDATYAIEGALDSRGHAEPGEDLLRVYRACVGPSVRRGRRAPSERFGPARRGVVP